MLPAGNLDEVERSDARSNTKEDTEFCDDWKFNLLYIWNELTVLQIYRLVEICVLKGSVVQRNVLRVFIFGEV